MFRKSMLASLILVGYLWPVTPAIAQNEDAVKRAKNDLIAANVDLQMACGAAKITNLVAYRSGGKYLLLVKSGGNRAVLKADGSCLDGDHSNEPGFATDYLIDKDTFFGYDILGDGGSANKPQWPDEPETAADMVARNKRFNNVAQEVALVNPANYMHGSVQPGPVDPPQPPATDPNVEQRLAAAEQRLSTLAQTVTAVVAAVSNLQNQPAVDLGAVNARIQAVEGRVQFLESRPIPASCSGSVNLGFARVPISCKLNP